MPPTQFSKVRHEGHTTFRRFDDEQVGRGMLSNIRYSSGDADGSGEEAVLVNFLDADSYYSHAGVDRVEGSILSDVEAAISDDVIAGKIVVEAIKAAKGSADHQEAIFGDGMGHESDPFWSHVEISGNGRS